jgi:cytochrome c oxidase subunit 4
MSESTEKHIVSFANTITVWVLLLIMTALTIWVAGLDLGNYSTVGAMLIATVKAILVLMFFMHLKYEPPMFLVMGIVCLSTLTVIILLTFADIWFR